MGDDLQAAAPFYGPAPKSEEVAGIRAALLVHYAEEDPRINAMRADFKAALEAAGVEFEMKPRRLGQGRPTGAVPLMRSSSQARAAACCGNEPTWA